MEYTGKDGIIGVSFTPDAVTNNMRRGGGES